MKSTLLTILLCSFALIHWAQKYDIPLNYEISQELVLETSENDSLFHTGLRPYNQWYLSNKSFNNLFKDSGDFYYDLTVLLYQKHLLEIHKKDVHIGMDLLLDFYYGNQFSNNVDNGEKRSSMNSRGFRIVANVGKNVSFETRFYENQFFLPNYLDSIANDRDIVFGIGRYKSFKGKGFDAGYSMGTVSYKVSKRINLKFGHDKIFIGHGYRSLLISDNAPNFPMLMLNLRSQNSKWQYMSTLAWMRTLNRSVTTVSTEALFKRKNANFHYLSFKPFPSLELGLFEATIYKSYDNTSGLVSPHFSFYNPVIALNTVLNGLQGENNSLIGINASYIRPAYQLFAQIAIDDVDKIGFQLGTKYFKPFGLKQNWIQLEFNSIPSFMYAHDNSNLIQNYSHMNQELAHPIGASFNEVTFLYHFEKNKWFCNAQFNFTTRIRGADRQLGENIMRPTDHSLVETTDYQNISTYYWMIDGGYEFNIKTRMQLFGKVSQRILNNAQNKNREQRDFYFVLGIRCNLNNFYYDL